MQIKDANSSLLLSSSFFFFFFQDIESQNRLLCKHQFAFLFLAHTCLCPGRLGPELVTLGKVHPQLSTRNQDPAEGVDLDRWSMSGSKTTSPPLLQGPRMDFSGEVEECDPSRTHPLVPVLTEGGHHTCLLMQKHCP